MRFLSDTRIEIEILLEGTQPIFRMIRSINGGDGMVTHLDLNGIPAVQDATIAPIKGNTGIGTGVIGNVEPQDDRIRKDHAAKAQNVGANGCNENAGDSRVYHGAPSCHTVGSRTRRAIRYRERKKEQMCQKASAKVKI